MGVYNMSWFNFILGLNFISFVSKPSTYSTIPKNKENKIYRTMKFNLNTFM